MAGSMDMTEGLSGRPFLSPLSWLLEASIQAASVGHGLPPPPTTNVQASSELDDTQRQMAKNRQIDMLSVRLTLISKTGPC